MEFSEKLDKIEEKIDGKEFRENKGLGNEVGYYIFDYPEEYELEVRDHVKMMVRNHNPEIKGYNLVVYDLYDLMIDYIEEKGFLEKCFKIEERRGLKSLINSVVKLLKLDTDYDFFTEYIVDNTEENSVVFIVGTGKIFPFVRVHAILNKLHQSFGDSPVVLFYPGRWEGQELLLFSEINDGNYYRAFRLID